MNFVFDIRESDSPFVDSVWRTETQEGGTFMSVASIQWQMVFCRQYGKNYFTVRGPETKALVAPIPENAEFVGINFKLSTFMPHLPNSEITDVSPDLPEASGQRFWLHSESWEFPTFENADTFIERLMRQELVVHDPVVDATLQGRAQELSLRSVQRRFVRAIGLTHGEFDQIERAHQATALLEQGTPILDVVEHAGYSDQPHLTRSLKRFVGRTPAEILRNGSPK
jgi:AraC-like DNA-binding protein